MKIKLAKLSAAELLQAAKGQFEFDITDEMLKAMGMDKEAATLGLLTKSALGDSNVNSALADIKSTLDALVAAVTAADTKALSMISATAAPIQPDGDVMKSITDLKAELATVKADLTKATEQLVTAVATIEALKIEKRPEAGEAAPTSGPLTPAMAMLFRQQQAAVNGNKSEQGSSLFPFDSIRE